MAACYLLDAMRRAAQIGAVLLGLGALGWWLLRPPSPEQILAEIELPPAPSLTPEQEQASFRVAPGGSWWRTTHPATAHLAADFVHEDEWYGFERSARQAGVQVLASLDEASYTPREIFRDLAMGDHPVVWSHCPGRGRRIPAAPRAGGGGQVDLPRGREATGSRRTRRGPGGPLRRASSC